MDFNNVVYGGSNWALVSFSDPDATVVTLGGDDLLINGTANAVGDTLQATVNGLTFTVFVTGADDPTSLIIAFDGNPYVLSNSPLTVGQVISYSEGSFGDYTPNPCFAEGTRIRTRCGDVAVEDLAIGDEVFTLLAQTYRPVAWIGRRTINCDRASRPTDLWPVCVRANAFSSGMPKRDVFLSPDHAVYLDGRLVPVRHLVNGATIVQEQISRVTYYHVELSQHDVLLAEDLPAESYLDTGNRAGFANADVPTALQVDFFSPRAQARRLTESCAPLVTDESALQALWTRLAQRAESLGYELPGYETTDDPNLCIVADGKEISPVRRDGTHYTFILPELQSEARLKSRSVMPSALKPWVDDRRRLGVMVRQVVVRSDNGHDVVSADDPRLSDGWWAIEHDDGHVWRWTDGNGALPVAGGAVQVEVCAVAPLAYPLVQFPGGDAPSIKRAAA